MLSSAAVRLCVCLLEVDLVTMASWWVDLSVCDEAIQGEEGGSNGGWDVGKGAEPKGFF